MAHPHLSLAAFQPILYPRHNLEEQVPPMIVLPGDLKKLSSRPLPNVVTSFNEEGYKRYGEAFIETFLKYWPPSVRLTVFYEGDNFPFTHGLSWVPIEKVALLSDYME